MQIGSYCCFLLSELYVDLYAEFINENVICFSLLWFWKDFPSIVGFNELVALVGLSVVEVGDCHFSSRDFKIYFKIWFSVSMEDVTVGKQQLLYASSWSLWEWNFWGIVGVVCYYSTIVEPQLRRCKFQSLGSSRDDWVGMASCFLGMLWICSDSHVLIWSLHVSGDVVGSSRTFSVIAE